MRVRSMSGAGLLATLALCGSAMLTASADAVATPPPGAPTLAINPHGACLDGGAGLLLTVTDADTDPGALVVTAASSDPTVLPDANLEVITDGARRVLAITAAEPGQSTITVTVSDGVTSTTEQTDLTVGTKGADFLVGTPRPDVILAGGGSDAVDAKAGDDLVCAGSGNDVVDGGPGDDDLYGQAGKDTLRGGPGQDTLEGGRGEDVLIEQSVGGGTIDES